MAVKGQHKSVINLLNDKKQGMFVPDEMKYRDILVQDNMQTRDKYDLDCS
jgi:hypothetical protein